MITDIIEYNNTLIKDLETVGLQSFQNVLLALNKKKIIFDSDQLLSHKTLDSALPVTTREE
jgi:hypothetical protein